MAEGNMAGEDESVFARWSRLKRGQRAKAIRQPPSRIASPTRAADVEAAKTTPDDRPALPSAEQPPSDLPDIASLTKESDFTPFLRADVPEELHRQALRMLWRSDPTFSLRDGLTDYDEDYTKIGKVEQVLRTAYRVGQGYLAEETPKQDANGAPQAQGVSPEADTPPSQPADRCSTNDPRTSPDVACDPSALEHSRKT
jgi:Protein of unknown function (DUF3306)